MCHHEFASLNKIMEVPQSSMRSEDCTCGTNSSEWLPDVKKQFPSYMYSNPFAEVTKTDRVEEVQHCSVCMKGFYNTHELQEHERTHMGGGGAPLTSSTTNGGDRVAAGDVGGGQHHHPSLSPDCDMLRTGSAAGGTCPHISPHISPHITTDCDNSNHTDEGRSHHSDLCLHNNLADKGGGGETSPSSHRGARSSNVKRLSEASSTTTTAMAMLYPCDLCGEKFTLRGNMVKHKKMHEGQRPFVCPTCGKEFSLRGNMKKHQVIHEGNKPFNCDICGRQFSLRGNLQQHQVVHTGAKPFICAVCGRQFSLRGNMEKHKRIHNY